MDNGLCLMAHGSGPQGRRPPSPPVRLVKPPGSHLLPKLYVSHGRGCIFHVFHVTQLAEPSSWNYWFWTTHQTPQKRTRNNKKQPDFHECLLHTAIFVQPHTLRDSSTRNLTLRKTIPLNPCRHSYRNYLIGTHRSLTEMPITSL